MNHRVLLRTVMIFPFILGMVVLIVNQVNASLLVLGEHPEWVIMIKVGMVASASGIICYYIGRIDGYRQGRRGR